MVMMGECPACAERTARVTFTTQSADSSGEVEKFSPDLRISRECSSMKMLPDSDASRGWDAGSSFGSECELPESVTRYAGLNIPVGKNAGP